MYRLLCLLVLAVATAQPRLSGTFITLTLSCKDWTANRWEIELDTMMAIGMRDIIVQESVYDNVAFYRSSSYKYWGNDPINNVLAAADKRGISVHLGLLNAQSLWFVNPQLAQLKTANLNIAKELVALFGHYKSFAGIYIPQEIDNLNWQTPAAQRALIRDFLAPLTVGLKALAPKRVMISAFFNPAYADPASYACLWGKILAAVPGLGAMLLQDGAGVGNTAAAIRAYFSKLKEVFVGKAALIGVVETFAGAGVPAPLSRLKAQMATLADLPLYNYHYANFNAAEAMVDSLYKQYKDIHLKY